MTSRLSQSKKKTKDIKDQTRKLLAIQDQTLIPNSSLDLESILTRICQAVVQLFQVDHSSMMLFGADFQHSKVLAEYPNIGMQGMMLPIYGVPLEEDFLKTQQPIIVHNVHSETELGELREILSRLNIQSTLIVPVLSREHLIGSFSLDAIKQKRQFTQEEIEMCKAFANQAAVAIEHARLFQEVVTTRDYLDRLVASSFDGIYSVDSHGNVATFNSMAERITGYKVKDVLGKSVSGLYYDTEEPNVIGKLLQQSYDGKLANYETSIKSKNGDRIPILLSGTWLFDAAGNRIGSVGYFRDLRQIQETEMQRQRLLQASKTIAQASNLEEGLLILSKIMMESCLVTFCSVLLLTSNERSLIVRAAYPIPRLERLDWNPGIGRVYLPHQDVELDKILMTDKPIIFRQGKKDSNKLLSHLTEEMKLPQPLHSILAVPLQTNERRLGVCILGEMRSWNRNPITEMKIELAQSLTNQTAIFIEKMRLYELTQQARDTARVFAKVSVLEDLAHTLNAIVEGTKEVLGCDAVTLYTYDQERDEFGFPPAMVGILDANEVVKLGQVQKQSVVHKILALEKIHEAEDVPSDSFIKGSFALREKIKSAVGIPLRVGGRKVGVMFVNYRSHHRFTTDETTNIELFANQAAVAIRNAQLHDETERRAKALAGLYQSGQVLTSTLALDEVLTRIADQALSIVGAKSEGGCFSYVALIEGTKLRFIAASPNEMLNKFNGSELDLANRSKVGIAGRAILTGMSQYVPDVREDADYIAFDPNTRSHLSVPLRVGERTIGVLSIEHFRYAAFGDEDVRNVEALVSQAVVALQNAQQYEELRQTKELVGSRTALAWMGMVSSTWQHAIAQRAGTISREIYILRHELANKPKSKAIDKRLDEIELLVEKIREIPITAPLSTEEGVQSAPVNALVRERAMQLWTNERYKKVSLKFDLQVEDTVTVRGSPEWLRRVVDIIVDNAVDAVAGQRKATVTIGSEETSTNIRILVSDNGHGIPSDLLPQLFIAPIQKSTGSKGVGMGLLLARTIVETYGGTILVQSTGAKGTTIAIILPKEQTEDQKIEVSQPRSIGFAPMTPLQKGFSCPPQKGKSLIQ